MNRESRIFIAGAHGMVGSALMRCFSSAGFANVLTPTRSELDLTDQRAVRTFIQKECPDVVVVAAAKVGGIFANMTYPADFIYDNLIIECNLIHEAHKADVDRLLFLGSTCIYPRNAAQPIKEESLLTSALEPTNAAYALAKIAGVKMCSSYFEQYGRRYFSAMPTNLYGPNDNYHPKNAHVIPALLDRFHKAKVQGASQVTLWGSGRVLREFLYVDDLARACLLLLECYQDRLPINVGSDQEVSIAALARLVKRVVGFEGEIVNDLSKPDGTPRKKSDISRIKALGWQPSISLEKGLPLAYEDYLANCSRSRRTAAATS